MELSIGLLILRIPYAVLLALGIAFFDILPVLGTGGILLPWAVILVVIGNVPLFSYFEYLQIEEDPISSVPGLEIYSGSRKIYCGSQELNLTVKEYDLLCLLVANKGCVPTYDQIYQKIWGEDGYGNESNAIGCHIRNLRE